MSETVSNHSGILPISQLSSTLSSRTKIIFTDVDDTLTCDGILPYETYAALYKLQQAGYQVIPVTGASAGWCDCLIKTWPVNHIIGENGALIMEKSENGIVSTHFFKSNSVVKHDMEKLLQLGQALTNRHPEIQYTQDQSFRLTDVAFDIGQTVTVDEPIVEQAIQWLSEQGVQARRSSIHINVWIGEHNKASSALHWLKQRNLTEQDSLFIGDSPNDESMFKQFSLTVGVANISRFIEEMENKPAFVTEHNGGFGFVDMANMLLQAQ